MNRQFPINFLNKSMPLGSPSFILKWLAMILWVGVLSGSASALFLASLHWITDYREAHRWLLALLPLGGLCIGLLYYYWGQEVVRGNNQILDEYYKPNRVIPLKMAPWVLVGTLITHLLGGSAGREGTAVQMGAAISDQFTKVFKLDEHQRKVLLIMGISGGFASVFGTPWAGAIFSLEILIRGGWQRSFAILPTIATAFLADFTCNAWGVGHTHYEIFESVSLNVSSISYSALAGLAFGVAALLFIKSHHFFAHFFQSKIKYPPLRPFLGGAVLAIVFFTTDTYRYMGLGVPVIESAFHEQMLPYDFLLKILFTSFTLAAGFKGGEVTPLFFIGATLGSALAVWIPLPLSLLAAMGFVAVFAGATNTPLASSIMGLELFGYEAGIFLAWACFVAYLFSGSSAIYASQKTGRLHQSLYKNGYLLRSFFTSTKK
jgi:H+/Cl- antiporter ClcA